MMLCFLLATDHSSKGTFSRIVYCYMFFINFYIYIYMYILHTLFWSLSCYL